VLESDADLTFAVRGVTLAVQNYRLRAARAGFNVGASEMMALSQLFMVGTSSPTALAAFLSMTTASATELLDRLERAGHIVRRRHPTDRRKIIVELTPQARATIERMFARAGGATARAARQLTAGERRAVIRFLREVADEYGGIDPAADVDPSLNDRDDGVRTSGPTTAL
jgi:DNA-binding MarR family transcriptional regulator